VYVVEHRELALRRALKVLDRVRALDASARARFVREGRALGAVRHPNVVEVFDVGVDDDIVWLVLEQLEGHSLAALLRDSGRLTTPRALELMLPIVAALAAVHEAGITHRDVTPNNIFVARTSDGRTRPVLLDFGVCSFESSSPAITQTDAILGTPAYMSPEQIRAPSSVEPVSDLFSLGVCLFEALTGATLFHRASTTETLAAVLDWHPARAKALDRIDSDELRAIMARTLHPVPSERFASALELGDALASTSAASKALWLRLTGRTTATRSHSARRATIASTIAIAAISAAAFALRPAGARPSSPPSATTRAAPTVRASPQLEVVTPARDRPTRSPALIENAPTKLSSRTSPRAPLMRRDRASPRVVAPVVEEPSSVAPADRVIGRGANGALILRHSQQ
jgi:serine/threonine protein kinase